MERLESWKANPLETVEPFVSPSYRRLACMATLLGSGATPPTSVRIPVPGWWANACQEGLPSPRLGATGDAGLHAIHCCTSSIVYRLVRSHLAPFKVNASGDTRDAPIFVLFSILPTRRSPAKEVPAWACPRLRR